jgi:hypothetical protein
MSITVWWFDSFWKNENVKAETDGKFKYKTYVKDAFPFLSSFERFQTKFFQKSGSKEFFLSVGVPENVKCDAYLKSVELFF